MRVRFADAVRRAWPGRGHVLKPMTAPAGYTSNTVITEWLTLNCMGAWAAQGRGDRIEVLFSLRDDEARARSYFATAGLWLSANA